MRILYFGNDLTKHGKTPTGINFLGDALSEHYDVLRFSDKKNQVERLLHMIWGLIANARQAHYALIDTYSTLGFYYAVAIGIGCKLFGVPYIPILRGGNLPNRLISSPFLSRLFLKNAHRLVIPSTYLQAQMEAQGYKTEFIPNLIDLSQYQFSPKPVLRPRLVWIRSLKSIYNPEMAVQVLALLRQRHTDATLCMIGPDVDGSEKRCRDLAKELGLNGELRFTGMLSKQQLRQTAASYDIFINTTNVDNTPMTVLEAMALGLPVVSTNVGGIPYLVEGGSEALLSEPGDHKKMAGQVEQLLNQPGLAQQLTAAAYKRAQVFDKTHVLAKWIELLK